MNAKGTAHIRVLVPLFFPPGTQARELQNTFVGCPLDVCNVREPVANLSTEVRIGSGSRYICICHICIVCITPHITSAVFFYILPHRKSTHKQIRTPAF